MLASDKHRIAAKLINACQDIGDALSLAAPAARYDPVLVPESLRAELAATRDDLARIIRKLEEIV